MSQLKSFKGDTLWDKHPRFKTYTIANSRELLSESSKVETKTIYYLNLDPGIIICIALLDDSANYKVTKKNCLDHIINCKMHWKIILMAQKLNWSWEIINFLLTFRPGFNVVSKDGTLATVAIDPAESDGWQCLGQCQVPGAARWPRLWACGHIANGRWSIVNSLSSNTEGVRNSLLKIVYVHEVFRHPLLDLLGIVCKN